MHKSRVETAREEREWEKGNGDIGIGDPKAIKGKHHSIPATTKTA